MKSLSGFWLPAFVSALAGSLLLFGISYWLETSLTQQFVADSTELLKYPRHQKSVVLASFLFVGLCFVSDLFLPKKLLKSSAVVYTAVLYCCYSLTNILTWLVLVGLNVVNNKDPFYYYFPTDLHLAGIIVCSLMFALAASLVVFWFRNHFQSA